MDIDRQRKRARKELLLYLTIFTVGIGLVITSFFLKTFAQNLLLSLGSNMMVVTLVFIIQWAFRSTAIVSADIRDKYADRAAPIPRGTQREFSDDDGQ